MHEFTDAYVMLGSNANALANLRAALARLRQAADVVAVSSVVRSAATGSAAGGVPYLNAAVHLRVRGAPEAFKRDVLQRIEAALGRDANADPRAVPIDLDLVLWGDRAITYGEKPWRSPDSDIVNHAFVAIPLAEIAPDVTHPDAGDTLAAIARRFADDPLDNLGRLLDVPATPEDQTHQRP